MKVAVEDSHNKVVTDSTASIELRNLTSITGGSLGKFDYPALAAVSGGVASFQLTNNAAGAFTLDAVVVDLTSDPSANGGQYAADETVSAVTSKTFKISPLHLVFIDVPKNASSTGPIMLEVAAENSKGQILTTAQGTITVGISQISGATGTFGAPAITALADGVATFTLPATTAGVYALDAGELVTVSGDLDTDTLLHSKTLRLTIK